MTASGHWKIVVKTPMGDLKIGADLVQEGAALSGTMHDDKNPTAPIQDAKVDGNRLMWKFPVRKPMSVTLILDVEVAGDSMTGTCKAGFFPAAPLTGSRG